MEHKYVVCLLNADGDMLHVHTDKTTRREAIAEVYRKYNLDYTIWTVSSYERIID